jgi:ribosomal protein S18 acetylase RimI-like enzyme
MGYRRNTDSRKQGNAVMENFIDILETSFERNLRRDSLKQTDFYKSGKFDIITHYENDKPVGFLTYWETEDFVYCEHFAVAPEFRCRGIGKKLFGRFMAFDKLKILEAEPPNNEINIKRIKYYRDFGMKVNEYEYFQPPYHDDEQPVKLVIMSSEKLSENDFNRYTAEIKRFISM